MYIQELATLSWYWCNLRAINSEEEEDGYCFSPTANTNSPNAADGRGGWCTPEQDHSWKYSKDLLNINSVCAVNITRNLLRESCHYIGHWASLRKVCPKKTIDCETALWRGSRNSPEDFERKPSPCSWDGEFGFNQSRTRNQKAQGEKAHKRHFSESSRESQTIQLRQWRLSWTQLQGQEKVGLTV